MTVEVGSELDVVLNLSVVKLTDFVNIVDETLNKINTVVDDLEFETKHGVRKCDMTPYHHCYNLKQVKMLECLENTSDEYVSNLQPIYLVTKSMFLNYLKKNNSETDLNFGELNTNINNVVTEIVELTKIMRVLKANILVQGPFSTGKSRVPKNQMTKRDLIITATCKNKEEYCKDKNFKKSGAICLTYASVLLELNNNQDKYKRVIIDEYYLINPLMIMCYLILVRKNDILVCAVGDKKQIKFVNRSKINCDTKKIFEMINKRFFFNFVTLWITNRTEQDVTEYTKGSLFNYDLISTNLKLVTIFVIKDSARKQIAKSIGKTNSIHKSQGIMVKTSYIELKTSNKPAIIAKPEYINVAITRLIEAVYMTQAMYNMVFSVFWV
ncbi:hypothetical protein G9A89_020189 [Geosiphon pyriformis]|nr:hypothetical protein G9A89_020189 [Geosiphon pyriformis]